MSWQPGPHFTSTDVDAAAVWHQSGGAALTAPGVPTPTRLVRTVAGLVGWLDRCGAGLTLEFAAGGAGLLTARAAMLGLPRSGQASCGGATRLLQAADGWVAVTLARPDDWAALPAWLGCDPSALGQSTPEGWELVERLVARRDAAEVVAAAVVLGMAAAVVGEVRSADLTRMQRVGEAPPRPLRGLRVANLAALWAGPLAADLLHRLGADVICVESVARPDGSRATPPWFDSLHAGQRFASFDLRTDAGVEGLVTMLSEVDVVIEGSRPRALEQLGIDAEAITRGGPRVWASITGHGRRQPNAMRVAFGDDAAAAGGLVGWRPGGPVFLADAVADPLAGLVTAATIVELIERGGRWLVDVALAAVAAAAADRPDSSAPTG